MPTIRMNRRQVLVTGAAATSMLLPAFSRANSRPRISHGAAVGPADVHYTAAHHYSPDRASFQDFETFWEFVSGPLHAGTFWPNDLDMTFGPRVEFMKAPEARAR